MSCSINDIPASASIILETTGKVRRSASEEHAGKTMTVRMYEANQNGKIIRYVTVKIEGVKAGNYGRTTWAKQFSGRNMKNADRFYRVNSADVQPA